MYFVPFEKMLDAVSHAKYDAAHPRLSVSRIGESHATTEPILTTCIAEPDMERTRTIS